MAVDLDFYNGGYNKNSYISQLSHKQLLPYNHLQHTDRVRDRSNNLSVLSTICTYIHSNIDLI